MYSTFDGRVDDESGVRASYDEEESKTLLSVKDDGHSNASKSQSIVIQLLKYSGLLGIVATAAVVWSVHHIYKTGISFPINNQQSPMKSAVKKLVSKPQKTGAASSSRPNIIMLLVDDMGYGTVHPDDSSLASFRPTLTEMYNNGIFFTNYYTQEVCSPARAALLTGRYPSTIGMQYNLVSEMIPWGMNLSEITLAEVLRDYGDYKNYAIGKWHLGHYQSTYLPTARGFDHYMGYLSGESYYWSKRSPVYESYHDMLYMDTDCYNTYAESDLTDYSTYLYGNKTRTIISEHDFEANPMFLYLAMQATHDPFHDIEGDGINGIPVSYVGEELYTQFENSVNGSKRLEYGLALYLLDQEISKVMTSLKEVNQLDNTYFIVASDNGGCYKGGGRNSDLRGCKGTLFEGGTHVDAFIYSPMIPESLRGSKYSNLMHVSDLFPTIVDMAGLDYQPGEDNDFDGVSHYSAMMSGGDAPRTDMLYNMYWDYNGDSFSYDVANSSYAIRNERYKLMHVHQYNSISDWYAEDYVVNDDDNYEIQKCDQADAVTGNMTYFFFDLQNDHTETQNLYTTDPTSPYYDIIVSLNTTLIWYSENRVVAEIRPEDTSTEAEEQFDLVGYITPWDFTGMQSPTYSGPRMCTPSSLFLL